jgi:hypothetical protein
MRWFEEKKIKTRLTSMDDAMDIIEISQTFKDSQSDLADNININWTNLLVNAVQRSFVHKFHTDANVGIGKKGAPKRDDVFRMAVVHDV